VPQLVITAGLLAALSIRPHRGRGWLFLAYGVTLSCAGMIGWLGLTNETFSADGRPPGQLVVAVWILAMATTGVLAAVLALHPDGLPGGRLGVRSTDGGTTVTATLPLRTP
jgi:hypothetical protein